MLEEIENGRTAKEILLERVPNAERKFKKLCKDMDALIKIVQIEFPDAQYYTASDGFVVILGDTHSEGNGGNAQKELVALVGGISGIGGGDF